MTMAAIGYILNKTQDQKRIPQITASYPETERPSMNNIYNSTYSDETLRVTAQKAQNQFMKSKNVGKTNDKVMSMNGTYMDRTNFTHNNMVPFFGGTIKQNVDKFTNSHILLNHNGTDDLYKSKAEVKSFYDQCQNIDNIQGSENNTEYMLQNIVKPIARNNDFPIPQVHVGPGINRGFTSKPTGGYQQLDVQELILPKTVDELRVTDKPKTTFAGVVVDGLKASVRGDLGIVNKNKPDTFYEQTPDMWLKTTGAHVKPMSVPEQLVKDTNRQDASMEYIGSAFGKEKVKRTKDSSVRMARRPILEHFDLGNVSLSLQGIKDKDDYGKANILVYENERDVTSTRVYQGNLTTIIKSMINPITDMIKVTKKEDTINNPRHFGNMSIQIPEKATIYDPNDVARTTLKEQLIHDSTTGNLKGHEKLTIYDPNDVARTTLKEQLIHDSKTGNLKGHEKLTIYDPNDVARTTLKEQLIHDSKTGNLKGHEKLTIYDPNDVARTTLKEQLIHDSKTGNLKGKEKLTIYDPNDVARTTLKEQLIHDNVINNLHGPTRLTVYDPDDVARTTVRDTTDNIQTSLNLKGHIGSQKYSDEKARATLAETLIDLNRDGNPERGVLLAGDAYDYVDWKIKMTQKQYLSDNDYYGGAQNDKGGGYITNEYDARHTQKEVLSDNDFYGIATANERKQPISTDDITHMTTKPNIESVLFNRDPTQTGNKTFNAAEYINLINRKNECDIKTVRETPNAERVYNEIPSTDELEITKMKKDYRQYDNERLDVSILKATLDNPLNIDIGNAKNKKRAFSDPQ